MSVILLESALRSCVLAIAVGLILALAQVRNPRLHRLAWRTVLVASLAMPLLMRATMLPIDASSAARSLAAVETVVFIGTARDSAVAWSTLLSTLYLGIAGLLAARCLYGL